MKGRKFIIGLGAVVILIMISLIALSLREKNKNKIVVSAEKVHEFISEGNFFYEPEQLKRDIDSEVLDVKVLDLRSPDIYLLDHITNAINIPYQRVLDDENSAYFKSTGKKVIYTDDEAKSAELWVLLKQLGYEDIYVLKGGFNYWLDKIENKNILSSTLKESEKAKYDFKKELSPDE